MGPTPFALLLLENQGNYTNPIQQRTTMTPPGALYIFCIYIFYTQSRFSRGFVFRTFLPVRLSDLCRFLLHVWQCWASGQAVCASWNDHLLNEMRWNESPALLTEEIACNGITCVEYGSKSVSIKLYIIKAVGFLALNFCLWN